MDNVFDLVNLLNSLSDRNILNRSFNDQGIPIKKCSASFVNDLETITITDSDVDMCCAICQDEFKLGDKAIKLPCSDSHYFHCSSDKELCGGILPWFENNNNCPICRTEFPEEPDIPIPDGDFDGEDVSEDGEEIINDIDNMSSELDNIIQRFFTIRPVTNPNPLPLINLRSSIYIPNVGGGLPLPIPLPIPDPTNENNPIPPIFTIYPINIPMNNYNEDEDPNLQEAIRLSMIQ